MTRNTITDPSNSAIISTDDERTRLLAALAMPVEAWAQSCTDPTTKRRDDLIRDKCAALLSTGERSAALGFFAFCPKPVDAVTPADVMAWREHLEAAGLAKSTIYARISRLSAFYTYLMEKGGYVDRIPRNPVELARPQAPRPYANARSKALDDDSAVALLNTVKAAADAGDIAAKRDYAMLRLYFATGKRRAEIADLRRGDIHLKMEGLVIDTIEKGSNYRQTEIKSAGVMTALRDYITASGRNLHTMPPDAPLWLRHDRAASGQQPVTSHGFVKALKKHALKAGIGEIHLHQTRHTVARIIGEESGNIADVQTVLDHKNPATTKLYLDRITVKKDRYSNTIDDRLGLE